MVLFAILFTFIMGILKGIIYIYICIMSISKSIILSYYGTEYDLSMLCESCRTPGSIT